MADTAATPPAITEAVRSAEFLFALRDKLRATIKALGELGVTVPSATVQISGVPIEIAYTTEELRISVAVPSVDYAWRVPLAWVMADPRPPADLAQSTAEPPTTA
jgi:hypothetical protein